MAEQDQGQQDESNAKSRVIEQYFRKLQRRSEFLVELMQQDHKGEALLLCCCYIERLANALYWPEESCTFNFVRVLKEHGQEELLWHIHPEQLRSGLQKRRKADTLGKKLDSALQQARRMLYSEEDLLALVRPCLSAEECQRVQDSLWRGTVAAVVYERIRCPAVHGPAASEELSFSNTTFRGRAAPTIGFDILHRGLDRVLQYASDVSVRTGNWYGHPDFLK